MKSPAKPTAAIELSPQEGGSYTRQPDGSLVRNTETAQVQDTPVDSAPTETTPQE